MTLFQVNSEQGFPRMNVEDSRGFFALCLLFYFEDLFSTLFRVIFELIKGEMAYVRDLENTETVCRPKKKLNQIFTSPPFPTDVHPPPSQRRTPHHTPRPSRPIPNRRVPQLQ